MGLRESFREMDTAVKILLVLVLIPVVLVIGFVLLVIFAAVLGTFVLGLGGEVDTAAPTASFSFEVTGGEVEVVHAGGDELAADRVEVAVNGDGQAWAVLDPDVGEGEDVGPGEAVTVSGVAGGDTVTVRWAPPGGDPAVLGRYVVP